LAHVRQEDAGEPLANARHAKLPLGVLPFGHYAWLCGASSGIFAAVSSEVLAATRRTWYPTLRCRRPRNAARRRVRHTSHGLPVTAKGLWKITPNRGAISVTR
jgi:hypothetical protein